MSAEHRWSVEKMCDGRWHACPLPRADRVMPTCSEAFFHTWRDAWDHALDRAEEETLGRMVEQRGTLLPTWVHEGITNAWLREGLPVGELREHVPHMDAYDWGDDDD